MQIQSRLPVKDYLFSKKIVENPLVDLHLSKVPYQSLVYPIYSKMAEKELSSKSEILLYQGKDGKLYWIIMQSG